MHIISVLQLNFCALCQKNGFFCFQTVASKLHNTEVEIEILKTKEECDHVQFLITEKSGPRRVHLPEIDDIETLSLGELIC